MASRCLVYGLSQAFLLEHPLHDALEEETHGVPGPGIHEHEMFERQQRASAGGRRRGGTAGGSVEAENHGCHHDTRALCAQPPNKRHSRDVIGLSGRVDSSLKMGILRGL
jgi:hypothetical protein